MNQDQELIHKDEAYAIIGAALEVWKVLGTGFLEPVYQEALAWEFAARKLPFQAQFELQISYKNYLLQKTYVADFVVWEKIIVEIKALEALTGREEAQALNYLKATGFRLALLINFGGSGQLQWKRLVR